MHTEEYDTARLLAELLNLKEKDNAGGDSGGGVPVLRRVDETHTHTDTVTADVSATSSWDWSGGSTWGFGSW